MQCNRICVLFLLAILTAGCATTAKYEGKLNSWVGAPADNLISTWGPPHNSTTLSNGGQVLEYTYRGNMQLGGETYTVPQTTYKSGYGTATAYGPGGTVNAYGNYNGTSTTYVQQQRPVYNIPMICTTRFTVDSKGIIRNWAWQGNNCKSR